MKTAARPHLLLLLCHIVFGSFRDALIKEANWRFDVWSKQNGATHNPRSKDGVEMRTSVQAKSCGGEGMPVVFGHFDVPGVRPVDIFNVISDFAQQPMWDDHCNKGSVKLLLESRPKQARGWAASFSGKPLSDRQFRQWEVAEANTTAQKFLLIFSTLDNEALRQQDPVSSGVEAQTCLAAYRITNLEGGARVEMQQHNNIHPEPLSGQEAIDIAWSSTVAWVQALRSRSVQQVKKGWNDTRLMLPDWMLSDRGCGLRLPDIAIRSNLVSKARNELNISSPGQMLSPITLEGGQQLRLWKREALCGDPSAGVPTKSVLAWRGEFEFANVQTIEAFNTLIHKVKEPRWNSQLLNAAVNDTMHGGARSVHEAPVTPPFLSRLVYPRELWEVQVVDHNISNAGTYLVVIASSADRDSAPFAANAVTAAQCLAAYELAPSTIGSRVVFTMHTNINAPGPSQKLLDSHAAAMLSSWAAAFITEAEHLARQRGSDQFQLDPGALALLAPVVADGASIEPEDKKVTSVADVLANGLNHQQRIQLFLSVKLPYALDTSAWRNSTMFHKQSQAVMQLYQLLIHNTTDVEASFFNAAATDAIEIQQQAEALASIQLRLATSLSQEECAGSLPDIDNNGKEHGFKLYELLIAGAATLFVLITAICMCCCRQRLQRWCCRCRCCKKVPLRQDASSMTDMTDVTGLRNPLAGSFELQPRSDE
eukprot:gnl/MRDRNA2_/MRDRNA2_253968_c0_seq1.p1 gnl/MRDRNA2_/MRDRNA2_253968_c0~~gnl/MRDRNA2_/MRDRNA2_253968_c0_seq1.p1  ORF type:complete len:709 (+),score=133.14 gnl/MRDRNA2_/MRDRNA2_253968_c0_seq1:2-2128(+)